MLRRWRRRHDRPIDQTGPATVYLHRSGAFPPPNPSASEPDPVRPRALAGDTTPPNLAAWPGPVGADITDPARAALLRGNARQHTLHPPRTEGPPQ